LAVGTQAEMPDTDRACRDSPPSHLSRAGNHRERGHQSVHRLSWTERDTRDADTPLKSEVPELRRPDADVERIANRLDRALRGG
jgi:hypothetical protein